MNMQIVHTFHKTLKLIAKKHMYIIILKIQRCHVLPAFSEKISKTKRKFFYEWGDFVLG